MENDDLLKRCLQQVETHLGWGPGDKWTTQDFKDLSEKIFAVTGTNLSVATLKRLWGTISYESKPTVTTLNALVQFIGYENWRKFEQSHQLQNHRKGTPSVGTIEGHTKTAMPLKWIAIAMAAILLGSLLVYFFVLRASGGPKKPGGYGYSFNSKKMVSEGVPNSVIFEYDASAADPDDTVYIQQSWDRKLRQQVSPQEKVHTSIYYYPGFFQAKLVVNDSIVKEHPLYIKSSGWLPVVEQEKVPVYFSRAEALDGKGTMQLPIALIKEKNVALQPESPWVSYFNIREFDSLRTDNFIFETEIRNDYSEGAAVCQHSEIHILLEGGALIIPLAIPGCVSELAIYDRKGKLTDPSPLGVDFSDWVKLRYEVKDKQGRLFINESLAYDNIGLEFPAVKLVGIRYRFQGTGSVNYVRLADRSGKLVYGDEF